MTPDQPNPLVYDFATSEEAVDKHLAGHMALLSELCCYGSNLFMRLFTERDRHLEGLVIIGCHPERYRGIGQAVELG
jgi:hypothetical protein